MPPGHHAAARGDVAGRELPLPLRLLEDRLELQVRGLVLVLEVGDQRRRPQALHRLDLSAAADGGAAPRSSGRCGCLVVGVPGVFRSVSVCSDRILARCTLIAAREIGGSTSVKH